MILTRAQILILAKEVLAGKARSYVSAAHALAEFIVDAEAETRILVGDVTTERAPTPTMPYPPPRPSPPDEDAPMQPWDAAGKRILQIEPKTHPRIVGGRIPVPFDPDTSTRNRTRACAPHGVVSCVVCNRGGAAE